MIEDFTIKLTEDEMYEYEETWPERIRKIHYPLNHDQRSLSLSPGNLAEFSIFDDVKVFLFSIYGKSAENNDPREAWADPIRIEVLKKLSQRNHSWYISADLWFTDPSNPSDSISFEEYLQKKDSPQEALQSISIRSFPNRFGTMTSGKWIWTTTPRDREFFEIPYSQIHKIVPFIWAHAIPGSPIEGYHLPSGRLDLLGKWGMQPLDHRLFRQVIDTCPVLFYTFPAENVHFSFLTNKWTLRTLENMLDIPVLQTIADRFAPRKG
ncbi:MAG TPA: hypothetical protein VIO36_02570 [Anaerolineaceae bacterium]